MLGPLAVVFRSSGQLRRETGTVLAGRVVLPSTTGFLRR